MKSRTSKLTAIIMLTTLAILTTLWVFTASATAEVYTDWPSYVPGETVTISGIGFHPAETVTVTIQWPSLRTDTVYATSSSAGDFSCTYLLPTDAQHGTYLVTATDQSGTSARTTFSGTEDFYGYNRDSITDPVPGNWTKGNLGQNYVEGDFVSYQLYLDNASKVWGATSFMIYFNFHQDNTNAIYIDGFDTSPTTGFQYTATNSLLPDGTPVPPGGWGVHIPTPAAGEAWVSGAKIDGYMLPTDQNGAYVSEPANPTPATVADFRAFNVTGLQWNTFGNGYVILFFRAHLALSIIWKNGLESAIPQQLDGNAFQAWTSIDFGASAATGSSRHFILNYEGIGAKTIPIPITQYPVTLINGYKYVDGALFNGWNITLTGNLTLGSGLPPIPYNPPMVQTGIGTFANGSAWPTGYFEFTGLVSGDYNVTEENRAGYVHVNIVTSGTGTNVATNIPEGWATFSLLGGGTETISFYNTFAHPNITLTKTPSSTKVENGTLVTYTYNVTNTGNVPLTVNLTDNQFGTIFTGKALAAGESNITTITRTLTANTTNVANATGFYPPTSAYVNATASATVRVLHPSISLTKVADASKVENGTSVTYTYNVTNTGDVALTGNVTDNVFGLVGTFTNLQSGSFVTFTASHILTANTTNIATVIGVDQLGANATAQATATVRVLHPSISLTKTPSSTKVENGTTVTYTYNVTNTGDVALTGNVTDDKFGLIGTFTNLLSLHFVTFTSNQILTANTTNIATTIGVDQLGANATAQATATVRVLHPSIALTKTPSATKVENGTNVTYTYNVTNTGDVALSGNVTDNQFGTIGTFVNLLSGQFVTFTKIIVMTTNTTNIATVIGVDQLGANATAQATSTVRVLHPSITLTKTPSSTKVENGTNVTYTYNITNTGDVAVTVSLVDNQFGTIFTGKVLASGESNITTITRMLTANTTNIATATWVDQAGATSSVTASATVRVLHPSIALTKVPSSNKVENGTSVTYTYNVTNTGDVALTGNVTDNVFGLVGTFTNLQSSSFVTFTASHVLTANTTNVATVVGVDQLGANATAQATATVRVLHPSISLTKTPSSTKVENGTTVSYTYNITNTGDVALSGNLTDNVFGSVGSFFNLAPGLWVTFTVPHALTQNTTNIATVFAVDQLGTIVNANATAFVQVIHPNLSLTKRASSPKVVGPGNVTYTYNVTNTGDTPLTVNLTDNVYGTLFTNKVLSPGQSNITSITVTINSTVTNTATAIGVDQLGATITRTSAVTLTVIHPAISITKSCAPEDQLAPGNITWTIVVKNIGDVPLTNINITESRSTLSNFTFPGPLVVNGTITITIIEINLPPGTYYNNATVIAAHQLGTVSAWDDAQCTIRPVFILKQFTGVTVLPIGISEGFNATLVNGTNVNVYGLKSGPKIYFNITYYFENSLNFLGDSFDGQAHNFTLWDKWGGNLIALGSPPVAFNQTTNVVTLADGHVFSIDPRLTGQNSYRGYIGSGLDISNLASQGSAWITMHLGDQQNTTNPGKGKGTNKDGSSYDTDTVWYIGELGVNQSATLTLFIAPGKNPGGQEEFTSLGCTVINTGPRVRAYGDTYNNEDFLYAVDRTNTLTVCVFPKIT